MTTREQMDQREIDRGNIVLNTPYYWHWEDAECTKDQILRLNDGFAWIVYPGCDVAVAVVSQDRELYKDDLFHWKVTDSNDVNETVAHGTSNSMSEARTEVEKYLGVGKLPTYSGKSIK